MKKNVMIIEKINTKPQWNVKSLRGCLDIWCSITHHSKYMGLTHAMLV